METEINLQILWEGELNLDHIRWNNNKFQEFKLTAPLHKKIQNHWENHIKSYPDDYDGSLLFLNDFHFKNTELFLDTSYMKFSTATYMTKNKVSVEKGIGVLGVQYLVFSPNKHYIIMGKRTLNESYYPGATTIPGGILEIGDLNRSPKEALMREAYEEIGIPLEENACLTAILTGWNGISVTFLISVNLKKTYEFDPDESIKTEQNEWYGSLKWFPITDLLKLNKDEILDGLTYYISKLEKSK